MLKITKIDLTNLNMQAQNYFYAGYDLYFLHGWFCSYLCAPSDSEEDEVIPTYLILDENKIKDEKVFAKFIDETMVIYCSISDNIFEKNKQLKPLGDLISPNNFSISNMDLTQKRNLLVWLYGYLCGYLVIGVDITEYCNDKQLLENKFFPALYTVCVTFLLLDQQLNPENIFSETVLDDYLDVKADILDLWEEVNDGETLIEELKSISLDEALNNLVNALNTIFYVIRVANE